MLALASVLLAVPAWFQARRVMDRAIRDWLAGRSLVPPPGFALSIRSALPGAIAIGKTGILTEGSPKVVGYVHQSRTEPEDRVLALAAALEQGEAHPLAREIVRFAGNRDLPEIRDRKIDPGEGVSGLLDGKPVAIGSREYVTGKFGIDRTHLLRVIGGHPYATRVYVAMAGKLAGILYLEDSPRPESGRAVGRLRRIGIEPVLVTGDNEQAAGKAAAAAGIEAMFHSLDPPGRKVVLAELSGRYETISQIQVVPDGRIPDLEPLAGPDLGRIADLFDGMGFASRTLLLVLILSFGSLAAAAFSAHLGLIWWLLAAGAAFVWPYPGSVLVRRHRPVDGTGGREGPENGREAVEGITEIPLVPGDAGIRLKELLTPEAGILGFDRQSGRLRVRYDRMKTNDRRIAELLRGAGLTDVDCGPDLPGNYSGPPLRRR